MNTRRIKQVTTYGWKHSGEVAQIMHKGLLFRIKIFGDILYCYLAYKMWSNQYVKEKFYLQTKAGRNALGLEYKQKGKQRDAWQKDFIGNRKFLVKYSNVKYEVSGLRDKRNKAYALRYNAGRNLSVEYDVNISRQHYLDGTISIGDNVLLAKHVFIDYSGHVVIKDNVQLTNGVVIETHSHNWHSDYRQLKNRHNANLIDNRGGCSSRFACDNIGFLPLHREECKDWCGCCGYKRHSRLCYSRRSSG